ncbi:hypothetical protein NUH87_26700 [Pseudomonas batumici]|uniref:hypothetical protein n=1 Tax=Pseudomonas batumici TaxID=226910 RepID=UPI0030CD2153
MTDYSELKRLAAAANTVAPNWKMHALNQAGFAHAAKPHTVLALIAENEALRKSLKGLIHISDATDWEQHTCGEIARARSLLAAALDKEVPRD